jgi:diguanylate cyclase (GGDEF)-like protein/PAS domain S-box-containing protein
MELRARRHRRADEQAGVRLRRSEARLHALLRDTDDVVAVLDRDGRVVSASPAIERRFGRPVTQLLGTVPLDLVHPDDHDRAVALAAAISDHPGSTEHTELRVNHGDGTWRTVAMTVTNVVDDPAVEGFVVTVRDITERRRIDAALAESQARFRAVFDHAPIGIALTTPEGRVVRANRALAQMLGSSEDALEGASMVALTHQDDRDGFAEQMRRVAAGYAAVERREQRCVHADGRPVSVSVSSSPVRGDDGATISIVVQVEDTSTHQEHDRLLAHQAAHDPLTGLPNRLLFVERLRHALAQHQGRDGVAVLFIGLDHFKVVNDSLGHPAGDRLLVTIADRLRAATRPTDIVARFEGDEFTVLCTGVADEQSARAVTDRLVEAIAKAVVLAQGEVFVTASVGIAIAEGEMDTPETLLRNADAAMHNAKDRGRSRTELYASGAHDRAVQHLRTGNELHRALERDELRLHYQPVVRLEDGRVTGFEALVRWQHPERGLVGPGEFIPLAEDTGLVVPIGSWVLHEACRELVRWHARGARLSVSVNLSPRQLAEATLPDEVSRILRDTGVQPDAVWLELTESTLMHDAEATIHSLGALRALGVHLAVDDFGTGYSSMAYLKRFPVDSLKIDRAFVDGLGRDGEDSAICTAVVSLAHALGLRAVGEGVETTDQLTALRSLGCDFGQGFLFGRPHDARTWGDRPDAHWAAADTA